ncbi:hypothetical protein NPIL_58651 [Nephila pilipes]|uniref:Uncharacterized protein n=1 Tax=Nephila pilipes TaxID=299642 RepID=A0A8X6PPY6_NEPPI|nr:hypothetical protein NPIL_58651 [Nephila pilipes]
MVTPNKDETVDWGLYATKWNGLYKIRFIGADWCHTNPDIKEVKRRIKSLGAHYIMEPEIKDMLCSSLPIKSGY